MQIGPVVWGGLVLNIYTWKLVYAPLSMRDAQYQTCLRQVLIMAITPFKVIQRHQFWYQSKTHMRLPVSD